MAVPIAFGVRRARSMGGFVVGVLWVEIFFQNYQTLVNRVGADLGDGLRHSCNRLQIFPDFESRFISFALHLRGERAHFGIVGRIEWRHAHDGERGVDGEGDVHIFAVGERRMGHEAHSNALAVFDGIENLPVAFFAGKLDARFFAQVRGGGVVEGKRFGDKLRAGEKRPDGGANFGVVVVFGRGCGAGLSRLRPRNGGSVRRFGRGVRAATGKHRAKQKGAGAVKSHEVN